MSFIRKLLVPKPPVLGRWNSVVYSNNKEKFSDQGNHDYCYTSRVVHGCEVPIILKVVKNIFMHKK